MQQREFEKTTSTRGPDHGDGCLPIVEDDEVGVAPPGVPERRACKGYQTIAPL